MNDMGKPAYPINGQPGVSKREYAAIRLRVPDSGNDLLDAMIRESRRLDVADVAQSAIIASGKPEPETKIARELREIGELAFGPAPKPEPDTDWPALPEGLPPLPDAYVYVGQGGQFQITAPFLGCMMAPHENRWSHGCWAGDECGYHYAVRHSDLHKIKRVRNEP